jgi:hypothetical protein
LRDADFAHHRPAFGFARSLAESLTPPAADEQAFRDFMDLWSSTALANKCGKPNVDFDRAVSLAARFEKSEIRMMAQTKLAQSILAGPPKRYKIPVRYAY